ncbi:MAG TPA: hypothetical protein VIM16_05890 [Mucilaginibacter sp.]
MATVISEAPPPLPAGTPHVASPRKNVVVLLGGVGTAPPTVADIAGRSEFTAANNAVPLPFTTPVTVVESAIEASPVGPVTTPANPLPEGTATLVTVPLVDVALSRQLAI